jgi:hypothetical protein
MGTLTPPKMIWVSYVRHPYRSRFAFSRGQSGVMEDAISFVDDFAGSCSSHFAVFRGQNDLDVSKHAANNIHRVLNQNYSSDINIPDIRWISFPRSMNLAAYNGWTKDQQRPSQLSFALRSTQQAQTTPLSLSSMQSMLFID